MSNGTVRRVETSALKNYRIKQPVLRLNADGEVISSYPTRKSTLIKKVTLLYIAEYDDKYRLTSYMPIDEANQFILSKHIVDGKLESRQISQGLALYYDLILMQQAEWDRADEAGEIDPDWDDPRPQWDVFPLEKANKLTFRFRDQIKRMVLETEELSRSTATGYVNAVVGFYKYWLRHGKEFAGKPFEFEDIKLALGASETSMKATHYKHIQTTDLRLSFPKSSRSGGHSLDSVRRDLKPFTPNEWRALSNIINSTRRIIRYGKTDKTESLPIEYSHHYNICRLTGLRAEEAVSLHLGQIVKPVMVVDAEGREVYSPPVLKLGVGDKYGSLTKTKEAGNKSRETIIPAFLMHRLYDYTQSDRYNKRLAKFKAWCEKQKEDGNTDVFVGDDAVSSSRDYLFIAQTGRPMMLDVAEFSRRWCDVRNTANHLGTVSHKIVGSIHNLRSTFAVDMFSHLIKSRTPDEALKLVSGLLGHEELDTTLKYLKIAQDAPMGDEIYEDVLDYIGAFDDVEAD